MGENNNSKVYPVKFAEGDVAPNKQQFNRVKMVLPAIVLATSFRYSVVFPTGIIIGYVLSKLFCHYFWKNGRVDSIFLDYGKWKIHLHHWIMGFMFLAIVWILDFFYLPTFFTGVVIGVIIQDIYDYNEWHQVILKKSNSEEIKAS
ncbi:MAG: hypothetical protein A3D35_00140 [Candidatus Staskawiczbacteria bacterium RIFCSPHIGHO2_02_FULL_34_9]|uniref:Uncharacterized protein n=1 Tax=Candidatus Staskawiczbacteria bacterium RIFCSPHIGHO2_02_FULL_34_9 TaxID=1802206 RepID=A0A1G2HZD7_9BACT|nr:MAG: hypothetical protein A3D35_00140 [Candidatus Staskawiczbacteria bacterium RIFCSPHIGHO2_02_FULL_34_9]